MELVEQRQALFLSGKVAHLHRFIFKLRFYAVELLDVIQSPIRFATAFFIGVASLLGFLVGNP